MKTVRRLFAHLFGKSRSQNQSKHASHRQHRRRFFEPLEARLALACQVVASGPVAIDESQPDENVAITFTAGGSGCNFPLPLSYSLGGTATAGVDYNAPTGFSTETGTGSVTLEGYGDPYHVARPIHGLDDREYETGPQDHGYNETIIPYITPSGSYTVLQPGVGQVTSDDLPLPDPNSTISPSSECQTTSPANAGTPGLGFTCDTTISPSGVRYSDGTFRLSSTDMMSHANGIPWGITRDWTSAKGADRAGPFGTNTVVAEQPTLVDIDSDTKAIIADGRTAHHFNLVSGSWQPEAFLRHTLTSGSGKFVYTDPSGAEFHFHDFATTLPSHQRGQLIRYEDPAGNEVNNIFNAVGRLASTTRESTVAIPAGGYTKVTESLNYEYLTSGHSIGAVSKVTLKRAEGTVTNPANPNPGTPTEVRSVEYSYYSNGDADGNAWDLKTAVTKEGTAVIDTKYYRYHTFGNLVGLLRSYYDGDSYARLVAAFPTTAVKDISNTNAQPYAINHLQYDGNRRVTTNVVQGHGSSTADGRGTYAYQYATPSSHSDN